MISLKFICVFSLFFCSLTKADDWKRVAQEDDIVVYTKQSLNGVLPFKAEGVIHANVEKVLAVLKDYGNKHLWSPKLKSVKLHQDLGKDQYIFSEYYRTPWPTSDREFLLKGGIEKKSEGNYLLSATSIYETKLEDLDHTQADVKVLDVHLLKISKNKTKMIFEFHGDMKGWIPVWLMNIIQKKWPLRFIQGLRERLKVIE